MTLGRIASATTVMLVLITCLGLAQFAPKSPSGTVVQMASPVGEGSAEPNLAAGKDGQLYLSWIETAGDGHALRFATRPTGGTWSRPQTIAQGRNWFVSWADFPSMLALPNGLLAANWLATINPVVEAYTMNITLSRDGGKTWLPPIVAHRDATENQHGFLSMVPAAGGGFLAVWLDGRKMDESLEMSLMYTTVTADGQLGPEVMVDGRVCDCCQTSAIPTADGMVVAYRDRSDNEVRDISVARLSNGRWSPSRTVSNDGWEIDGCPINGPSIAASDSTLTVAWYTITEGHLQVKAAMSTDGGTTFGKATRVDDGKPIGRVDVVATGPDESLVSWVERVDKGAQIRARYVKTDGTRSPAIVVSEISPSLSSGFPRMEKSGNEIVFAWTDVTKGSTVRTAVLNR